MNGPIKPIKTVSIAQDKKQGVPIFYFVKILALSEKTVRIFLEPMTKEEKGMFYLHCKKNEVFY